MTMKMYLFYITFQQSFVISNEKIFVIKNLSDKSSNLIIFKYANILNKLLYKWFYFYMYGDITLFVLFFLEFRSAHPGHEYLEADYECASGYYMTTNNSRLLCKNRRWIGEVPKCRVRQNPSELCAEMSCEQVCNEVDGRAQCSCFEGFQADGRNCIGEMKFVLQTQRLNFSFFFFVIFFVFYFGIFFQHLNR